MQRKAFCKRMMFRAVLIALCIPFCGKAQYIGQADSLMNVKPSINQYGIPGDIISSLQTNGSKPGSWLKPVAGTPLTFTTQGVAEREITLIPYYKVHHERYVIYWDIK